MINTTKQDIELLLPFYINGTLDSDEKERVELALSEDINLQEELVFLQGLQVQVQQQQHESSPGELGLKRLQKMLKQEQAQNDAPHHRKGVSLEKNGWQLATMAACLMLVVQTVTHLETSPNTYVAAGGSVITQHEGKIVSVTFAPDVSEQQIRQLLLETHVFIVDGPSALGIYRLAVVDGNDATINKLASHTDLIESIQEE